MTQSLQPVPLLPRIAGRLTQLCGAGCVLVGTVAFALLIDHMDGIYLAILAAWVGAGMAALICGGWAGRPSPTSLVISAALDAAFAGVLFAVATRLPVWLKMMSPEDTELASTAVISLGITSAMCALLCLVATPRALRFWRVAEPAGGPALAPANTSPGFPPPVVTGAFRASSDSGEIVVPVGGGPAASARAEGRARKPASSQPPPLPPAPPPPLRQPQPQAASAPPMFAPAQARGAHQGSISASMATSMAAVGPSGAPAPSGQAAPPAYAPYGAPMPGAAAPPYAHVPHALPPVAGGSPAGPLPLPPGFDGTPPPYLQERSAFPPALPGYAPGPPAYAGQPYGQPPQLYAGQPYGQPYAGQPYAGQPSPAQLMAPESAAAPTSAPARSRRGLVLALAGLAVGGVCVVAVLLADQGAGGAGAPSTGKASGSAATAKATAGSTTKSAAPTAPASALVSPAAAPGTPAATAGEPTASTALTSVEALLDALHLAVERSDASAVQQLLVPRAFAFAVKATGVHRTAEQVAAAFASDVGPAPSEGFTVTARGTTIGREGDHAWVAEELEVRGGGESRTFAITLLAAAVQGSWRVVAWHWANRLPDETVARLAKAGDLPIPEGFDDQLDAPDAAVEAFRSAFSSTESFALVVSGRDSTFNFGSAPGERLRGGGTIRRVFKKLHADISIREGVMVTAAGAWDSRQVADPDVAWGAANVEFSTSRMRRILRVLAVLVREGQEWRVVQTQWSDGA